MLPLQRKAPLKRLPDGPEPTKFTAQPKPNSMRLALSFLEDNWDELVEGLTRKALDKRLARWRYLNTSPDTRVKARASEKKYWEEHREVKLERLRAWQAKKKLDPKWAEARRAKDRAAKQRKRAEKKRMELVDEWLKCPYCDAKFANDPEILKRHVEGAHPEKTNGAAASSKRC